MGLTKKQAFYLFLLLYFFGLFAISWAIAVTYGGSQARRQIGAVAAGLHQSHSNAGSIFDLHHSSWQRNARSLTPRDRTRNLMVPSQIH